MGTLLNVFVLFKTFFDRSVFWVCAWMGTYSASCYVLMVQVLHVLCVCVYAVDQDQQS